MTDLSPGDRAPDFALETDAGTVFTLSAQRGQPVVLYFYPEDDSGGCTDENIEFSDLAPEFERLGAVLAGISPDDVARHKKFRDKYGLRVTLLADPDHLAIGPFGLWRMKKLYGREFEGLVRTSFIVGADGRIADIVRATRIRGHAARMLDRLKAHLGA